MVSPAEKPASNNKSTDETISRRHLSPRAKVAFIFSYIGRTAILLPLFAIGFFLEPVVTSVAVAAYILMILIVAQLVYQNYFFSIDEEGFQKWYGIIHKNQVSIPFEQIQNVNITRSLLDQMLGLSRIHIETAGGANTQAHHIAGGSATKAEALLPGVTLNLAREIHDLLLEKASENQ